MSALERHPEKYKDPLEAKNQDLAIGVSFSNHIGMASGRMPEDEWIRFEGEPAEVKR